MVCLPLIIVHTSVLLLIECFYVSWGGGGGGGGGGVGGVRNLSMLELFSIFYNN